MTAFEKFRQQYKPRIPDVFSKNIFIKFGDVIEPDVDEEQKEELKKIFTHTYNQPLINIIESESQTAAESHPLNIGVVLSGGQAPGGHNVICGIYDAAKKMSSDSKIIGFLGGPSGILNNETKLLNEEFIKSYKNSGGFDMLGSGRTKISSTEQFKKSQQTLEANNLDSLIIIGGDDSNTNSAFLAEYLKSQGSPITVVGVPKTIDGDLKNEYVETSFGFHTASSVYSELIGNIARDALSAKKYYHFIRLMGRSASHLTLDVALNTHPNYTIISEEIEGTKKTLDEIINNIADIIVRRAEKGKNYGVVLVPEGLIEFIPEAKGLISELNKILSEDQKYFNTLRGFTEQSEYINRHLTKDASYVFSTLPVDIQRQLLMDRDPHGNVQVSRIETEKLLIELVISKLNELKAKGKYKGTFSAQTHFLGYEGRCAAPTNFDADYSYSLGFTAVALINAKASGYMAVVKNIAKDRSEWKALGVPIIAMMNIEIRNGVKKPVIKKSLVSLEDKPFQEMLRLRGKWAIEDLYRFSAPIQYFGPEEICDQIPPSLAIENL